LNYDVSTFYKFGGDESNAKNFMPPSENLKFGGDESNAKNFMPPSLALVEKI
jgi:hypothetical protein